jgi:hypothetical protein
VGLGLKDGITGPEFQYVLGHKDLKRELEFIPDLVAEYRQSLPLLERPIWKTIQLGTHANNKALRQSLLDTGYRISDWAGDILKKTAVSTEPTEANVVIVTAAELGFPDGATRQQIYDKAISMGFELCPAEVGPQLRLQYPADEQPMNEWLFVAMEPIKGSGGHLEVFSVGRGDDGAWLYGDYDDPDDVWDAGFRWLFRRK